MVAESKKIQTLVNVIADQGEAIRLAVSKLIATRSKFNTANPDANGTVVEGNLVPLNNSLNRINAEISKQVWTDIINARSPSHRNKALD